LWSWKTARGVVEVRYVILNGSSGSADDFTSQRHENSLTGTSGQ
jgi:hypothetical protein